MFVNYFPDLETPKISYLLLFTQACFYSMHHIKFIFAIYFSFYYIYEIEK